MSNNAYYACECSLACQEYRAKAKKYRESDLLRQCYLELAWKNRKQAREYFLLAE